MSGLLLEDRLDFHGFWFAGGLVASFATGSAVPVVAVVACSVALEWMLAGLGR